MAGKKKQKQEQEQQEATVEIEYSHPYDGHEVGDREELPRRDAKALIGAGMAQPATKREADKVNGG